MPAARRQSGQGQGAGNGESELKVDGDEDEDKQEVIEGNGGASLGDGTRAVGNRGASLGDGTRAEGNRGASLGDGTRAVELLQRAAKLALDGTSTSTLPSDGSASELARTQVVGDADIDIDIDIHRGWGWGWGRGRTSVVDALWEAAGPSSDWPDRSEDGYNDGAHGDGDGNGDGDGDGDAR